MKDGWWLVPIIPKLERRKQEDQEFKFILVYLT